MENKYTNDFPIYRKLSNNKSFYKILDDKTFDEIQLVGSKKNYYKHVATQYPELLRIKDMIDFFENLYFESNQVEWDLLFNSK